MKLLKEIVRYPGEPEKASKDYVVLEDILEITINCTYSLKISAIPDFHRELLYGLLLTSGTVKSSENIKSLDISGNSINVEVDGNTGSELCIGASGSRMHENPMKPGKREKFAPLPHFDIRPVFKEFRQMSQLFRETGAVHSSALMNPKGEILYFSEDVGRHNAIDKTIGKGMLEGCNFEEAFLMTSGRISGEIARKTAFAKLKGIFSPSAPTSMAIDIAKEYKLTVAGFIRENRYNIYTVEK